MKYSQCDWIKHEDDRTPDRKTLSSISSISTNPDGSKLVTSGLDTKIRVWSTAAALDAAKEADPAAHRLLFTGTAHTGSVMCARFSNSGRFIASGSDDRTLAIWELQADSSGQPKKVWGSDEVNIETWKPVRMLSGHENDILSVAWSPDDAYLASGGVDTMILIWDGDTFAPVRKLVFHTGFVKGLVFDPAGQFLASQSDDSSLKIYDTRTWSMVSDITRPFIDAPRDSSNWFLRPGWSPCGSHIVAPNAMNGPVFVAASIERGSNWSDGICLVGHQNIVSVAAFNPRLLRKDTALSVFQPGNIVSILAMAARSSISIWHTTFSQPILVFHDVVERDIMDLNWSRDGQTLWACSSDGHVVALHFDLSEITHGATACDIDLGETYHKQIWGDFKRVRRALAPQSNSMSAPQPAQPAAPPQPQRMTILPNGKKRIQPSFVSGLAQPSGVQSFDQNPAPSSAAVFPVSGPVPPPQFPQPPLPSAPHAQQPFYQMPQQQPQGPMNSTPNMHRQIPTLPTQPMFPIHERPSAFAAANAAPAALQHTHPMLQGRDIAMPHTYPDPAFASSALVRDAAPPNLETDFALKPTKHNRNVRGATIGGNREKERREPLIDEISPAFILEDGAGSSKEMRLAVPAVKTLLKASPRDWTETEAEEQSNVERIEVRNFKPATKEDTTYRPSEISLWAPASSGDKSAERTMWLDYQEFYVVAATWNGVFGAVSSLDGMLTVYSTAGRRAMPSMVLDAPCSFLDSAGPYLLAITAKGRMHLWHVGRGTTVFPPVFVTDLLSAKPGQSDKPTIQAARIRPNGAPVVSLSDGRIFSYAPELQAWTPISMTFFSKGSDFWEGRMRSKSTNSRGILKTIEGTTNDILVEERYWQERQYVKEGSDDVEMVHPRGEEKEPVGQDSDWTNAISLAHLETRLNACDMLDSGSEYRQQLTLYCQRLASENLRSKAEELVRFLMGPVYFKPGLSDTWKPTVAGLQKRELLKEVLSQWSKTGPFKKLAGDAQDLLRRVLDPM